MKVFTHNFNPQSNSGPNKFTRQLFRKLISEKGFKITSQEDCEVEFCLIQQTAHKKKPMVLRLDGIYFNSEQDFKSQNAPIKFSYDNADAVVFQSEFNKKLTEIFDFEKLEILVQQGLLEVSKNNIRIPDKARLLTNAIIEKITNNLIKRSYANSHL